jgi:phosphoribosylformimino-5-aminoimidazole carboxamide ribotide isomerase
MIEIIPAIDIIDGKCVRLYQGDYNQKKVYDTDPVDIAKAYETHGIKRLHIVDLDGARGKHKINYHTLEAIAKNTNLVIDFGGGIRTDYDIEKVFEHGADFVNIGSVAVTNKSLFIKWLEKYGNEKIILGADVKDNKIAISGWEVDTNISLTNFIAEYSAAGIKYIICSDIRKDGTLTGTSIELYREIIKEHKDIKLIASGGLKDISEIKLLEDAGLYGVIIGKAIYEGKITLKELKMNSE